jgi:NADP-dependent 3-hydroxy acid dehydrogenase YdfG
MLNNAGLMPQAPLEHLKVDEWDDRREHQGRAVRHRGGAAVYEAAESRAYRQRLLRGWP